MNIAIIGAGAIGSAAAAYLTKSGQDVTLIGKDDQVKVVQKNGLKVSGARGEETVKVKIFPKLEQEHDLVIFAVKTQDLQDAVDANREYLQSAILLSSQNGVQADKILSKTFPREQIISSIVMFGATYIQPGEVTFNFEGDWILGKPFGANDGQVSAVAGILKTAFPVAITDAIIGMKWLKLFVNFNNCIPAIIGKSMQETFSDLDLCRLSIQLLKEGVDIVQKAKIQLVSLPQFPVERITGLCGMPVDQAAGIMNKTLTTLSREPLYGSILQSIMRKRTSEIEFINGEVVRLAHQMGTEAPLNQKIVEMVHRVESFQEFLKLETVKNVFKLSTTKA